MELQEIYSIQPPKLGYHLNQNPLALCSHPSGFYMAFATRGAEVVFHNRKTGRAAIIFSSKHGIGKLFFSEKYLLVVERTNP